MPYCPLYARIFFIFKIFTIAYLGATPEKHYFIFKIFTIAYLGATPEKHYFFLRTLGLNFEEMASIALSIFSQTAFCFMGPS